MDNNPTDKPADNSPKGIQILRNERGIAIMVALSFISLMLFIAMEVSFDTIVENEVTAKSVNRLKAYYNAKAAVELGLLRVHIYRTALSQFGSQLGEKKSMLDPIWNFPFAWPASEFMGEQISGADKELIQSSEKNSIFEGRYFLNIENEGSKIDINELGSPIESMVKATHDQLVKIFQNEMEANEAFREQYSNFDFERLLNNIKDWVDEDTQSGNGGDEGTPYADVVDAKLPPNAAFKTLDELMMVKDMSDDIFKLLKNKITVYGIKGINPNYASKEVLQALDPRITEEMVTEIVKRRNDPNLGGPFSSEDEFKQFLGSIGLDTSNFNTDGIPLLFDPFFNFRIIATGEYKNVTREIQAVTYDVTKLKTQFAKMLDDDERKANGGNGQDGNTQNNQTDGQNQTNGGQQQNGQQQNQQTQNQELPKGRPTVVYWSEN